MQFRLREARKATGRSCTGAALTTSQAWKMCQNSHFQKSTTKSKKMRDFQILEVWKNLLFKS